MQPRPFRPGPLMALSSASVAGLALAYLGFVQTGRGARVDEAILAGRGAATAQGVELAQDLLTTISVATLALAIAVLVVQALARGRLTLSAVAAAVVVGSVLTTEALKDVILTRPELVVSPLDFNSFPSGHATVAFSVGVAATLVVPAGLRDRVAVVAVAYGAAIGISTVAAGWHRPSDVLGAYLVTIAWAAGTVAVAGLIDRGEVGRGDSWPGLRAAAGYLAAASAALFAGFVLALAIALAGAVGVTEWTRVNAAFLAGCGGLLAAAALLMAALLVALNASFGPTPGTRVHSPAAG